MEILDKVITTLPFYKVPETYVGGTTKETPFYFQKAQCLLDCHFGTITDRNHLPPFIVRMEESWNVETFSSFSWEVQCADGSSPFPVIPEYRWTIIAFITSADLAAIVNDGPTIGDTYYLDDGVGDVELYIWNGAGWSLSGQLTPQDNDLINVTSEGFVYAWVPDPETTEVNLARIGSWEKTSNGMQLCNLEGYTYLIYNGFAIEELPCGLKQVEIDFGTDPSQPDTPANQRRWMSELIDIREFNPINNDYHKITISNDCALGNIPYADVRFKQWYYFNLDTLIGEPKYSTDQEKQTDGLGKEKLIYSRTVKTYELETKLVPEYIIDFFNFVTMHDFMSMTYPLEFTNEITILSEYKGVKEIDRDNFTVTEDWIDSACYASLKLNFGLVKDVVDTACCQPLAKDACLTSSFDVTQLVTPGNQPGIENNPPALNECFLILVGTAEVDPDPPSDNWFDHINEIACWNGTAWVYTIPDTNTIVNNLSQSALFPNVPGLWIFSGVGIGWNPFLSIDCVAVGSNLEITGYAPTGTTVYLYYRLTGTFTWILEGTFQSELILAGYQIGNILPLVDDSDYDVQILSLSNNCDYGRGEIEVCHTNAVV